jgi:hypothetical protein
MTICNDARWRHKFDRNGEVTIHVDRVRKAVTARDCAQAASVVGAYHAGITTDKHGPFQIVCFRSRVVGALALEDIVALNDRATCSTLICHQSPAPDLARADCLASGGMT